MNQAVERQFCEPVFVEDELELGLIETNSLIRSLVARPAVADRKQFLREWAVSYDTTFEILSRFIFAETGIDPLSDEFLKVTIKNPY